MMAAGGIQALPARDHRRLHDALAVLDSLDGDAVDSLWLRFGGRVRFLTDPGSGRKPVGATPALWDAAEIGHLTARESGNWAELVLNSDGTQHGRRLLMQLPAEQACVLTQVGEDWASASTARKKAASARAS